MTDKTKAEAAAYAVEIELLTRALYNFGKWSLEVEMTTKQISPVEQEMFRRLRVLLDLEEGK